MTCGQSESLFWGETAPKQTYSASHLEEEITAQ